MTAKKRLRRKVIARIKNSVYRPRLRADGTVNLDDWNGVPLNTWVQVEGSSFKNLENEIVRVFNEAHGTNLNWTQIKQGATSVRNTVNGWTAGLVDDVRKRIVLLDPGGHSNGSVNGEWYWDILQMHWGISRPPSNPYDITAPWGEQYRKSNHYTQYNPNENPIDESISGLIPHNDILPSGEPTSRHQYQGEVHDTKRDAYHSLRESFWTRYADGTVEAQVCFDATGVRRIGVPPIVIYDEYNDVIWGHLRRYNGDYHNWSNVNLETGELTKVPAPISGNFGSRGGAIRRLPGTEFVLIIAGNERQTGEIYSVMNLRTRELVISSRTIEGGRPVDYRNELPACCHVPEWGPTKWLRRMTREKDGTKNKFYLFDHETGVQEEITWDIKPWNAPRIGNKLTRSEELKALVIISDESTSQTRPAVWMMRLGDAEPPTEPPEPPARDDLQKQIDEGGDVVVIEPGRYHGSAVLEGSKDVNFNGVEILGPTGHGAVVCKGGPHVVRNLSYHTAHRSTLWLQDTPIVEVRNLDCSNTEHGIITSNNGGELRVYDSKIANCKGEWGRVHNIYAGEIDYLEVDNLQLLGHQSAGHLLKSRAPVNRIRNSTFDGLDTRHSRVLDFPCGGEVAIHDCTLRQSPNSDNNDLIAIAVEACQLAQSTLTLKDTHWQANKSNARFLTTHQTVTVVCEGDNVFENVDPPECADEPTEPPVDPKPPEPPTEPPTEPGECCEQVEELTQTTIDQEQRLTELEQAYQELKDTWENLP